MNFMKLSLYPIDGIAEHLNLSMEHDAFNTVGISFEYSEMGHVIVTNYP